MGLAARLTILGRLSERRLVELEGTVRHQGEASDTIIHDLSCEGFRASVETAVSVGDEISVGSPSLGVLRGRVVWVERPMFGAQFATPIPSTRVHQAAPVETVVSGPFGGMAMKTMEAPVMGSALSDTALGRFRAVNKVTVLTVAAVVTWAGAGLLCQAALWFVRHGL